MSVRAVRAIASLVGIVAILVGIPILLWQLGTPLLPSRVPSLREAVAVFLRPDDGSLLMGILLAVGVLVWAQLSVSILAELVAALRHRPGTAGRATRTGGEQAARVRPRRRGTQRRRRRARAGGRADRRHRDRRPCDRKPDDRRCRTTGSSPMRGRELPRYVVQERDSLWRIAETRLGDPLRWREIYDLNHAVVQPDGGRLTEATLLHPGWTLLLPADAATTDATAVVHPGDTLGKIAGVRLHDPRRAHEIFALNVGRPQPNGVRLTDPDRIQPGWRLTLPAPSDAPTPRPHPAPPRTDNQPPAPTVPSTRPPSPSRACRPDHHEPSPNRHRRRRPPRRYHRRPAARPHPPAATPNADPAPVSAPVGVVAEWGVSALVVSGLVAALALGRRRQQRRRGYRRRIAVPDDPAGRREWHAVTTPSALDTARLDAALRGLALRDWSNETRAGPDPRRARPRSSGPAPGRPDHRGASVRAGRGRGDLAAARGRRPPPGPGRGRPLLRPLPVARVGRGRRRPAVAAGSGAPGLRHGDRRSATRRSGCCATSRPSWPTPAGATTSRSCWSGSAPS